MAVCDPARLRAAGVLGINARNSQFVLPCNPRCLYPRVDDKLQTKAIAQQCGIAVPETYLVVRRYGDVRRLPELVRDLVSFVIKPARGAGGRGIIVVADRDGDACITASGNRIEAGELQYHTSTTLSGLYSLGGRPDAAIVEARLLRHPAFDDLAVGGTPDLRIIVYQGRPAMAMVRLPTVASRGRANLHQGAIGAGIDMATGCTLAGVQGTRVVSRHPDTGVSIVGIAIPGWSDLLTAATRLAAGIGLDYLGIDFVIDANRGPVMLEANARPGLAIQIANRRGLLPALNNLPPQQS